MESYYDILGINNSATKTEIKISYHKLAKIYHPDKNNDDTSKEHFQKIQEAYETLYDDDKRHQYDNRGHFNFPFNIFQTHQQTIKKSNEYFDCKISLYDVYKGVTKHFCIKKKYICDTCKIPCAHCQSKGFVVGQRIQIGPFVHFLQQPCNVCLGNCVISDKSKLCNECNSIGYKYKEKKVDLQIPQGVENGKEYVFEGWGEQKCRANEVSGDFIIRIIVENNTMFQRSNLDLLYAVNITIYESLIGKDIEIPYFDENIKLNISIFGIINPNKEYIIMDKGLRNETGVTGNMKIKFNVSYPEKTLNEKELNVLNETFNSLSLNII